MEFQQFAITLWIITLLGEVPLCLAAPFQPDPFQGMDNDDGAVDGHRIQFEVLQKLGIHDPYTPPTVRKEDLVIPDHIYAKYNSLLRHHRVKRGKSITRGVRENPAIRGGIVSATLSRHVYTFDMTSIPAGSELVMAELRIYKELPNQSIHKPNDTQQQEHHHRHEVRGAMVSIHQKLPEHAQSENSQNGMVKVYESLIDVDSFGWKNFDVTNAVAEWMTDPSTNQGLELHVNPERNGSYAQRIAGRVRFSPEEEPDNEDNGAPELIIYTVKYSPVDEPVDCSADGSDANRCCRSPKYVDFRRTTWANRWIIEPAGFDAYECQGSCRAGNGHRHRTLREVFALRPSTYQTCGAARFSSLPMMYLIDRNGVSELEVEEIPNMIVEECECTA